MKQVHPQHHREEQQEPDVGGQGEPGMVIEEVIPSRRVTAAVAQPLLAERERTLIARIGGRRERCCTGTDGFLDAS